MTRARRLTPTLIGSRFSFCRALATCDLTILIGLPGGLRLVRVDPAVLLADVGDLDLVGVEAGQPGRLLERLLVKGRRAGGDDDAVEVLLLDRIDDHLLAGVGAHIDVIRGERDPGVVLQHLGDLLDVDDAGDIDAAVADEQADPLLFVFRWGRHVLTSVAGISLNTLSAGTRCSPSPRTALSTPSAQARIWVKNTTGIPGKSRNVSLMASWRWSML